MLKGTLDQIRAHSLNIILEIDGQFFTWITKETEREITEKCA